MPERTLRRPEAENLRPANQPQSRNPHQRVQTMLPQNRKPIRLRKAIKMNFRIAQKFAFAVCLLAAAVNGFAQSGHSSRGNSDAGGEVISLVITRSDGNTAPIKMEELFLYENGQEQRIGNLAFDPSPSRIVLLVDNSERLGVSVEALQKAAMEFAYEIFDGDQLYVLAYDERAEIVQDWTDDAKKMEASLATFRQKGNPYLFEALHD